MAKVNNSSDNLKSFVTGAAVGAATGVAATILYDKRGDLADRAEEVKEMIADKVEELKEQAQDTSKKLMPQPKKKS